MDLFEVKLTDALAMSGAARRRAFMEWFSATHGQPFCLFDSSHLEGSYEHRVRCLRDRANL